MIREALCPNKAVPNKGFLNKVFPIFTLAVLFFNVLIVTHVAIMQVIFFIDLN